MTFTTVRPASSSTSGTTGGSSVSNVGGAASLHAATADNSDTTYALISKAAGGGDPRLLLTFANPLIPSQDIIVGVDIRVRGVQGTGGGRLETILSRTGFTYPLPGFEGLITAGGSDPNEIAQASGSITTVTALRKTQTTYFSAPGVIGLRRLLTADVTAMTLWLRAISGTLPQSSIVIAAYLDVYHVPPPTVTVSAVTPDPYTASNLVPLTAVPVLDSDGGPQTHIEWKVFTAAQYGAGGFDPDTSTSEWESGEMATSSPSVVTGGLPNTTVRAYCRVAQTVMGVKHRSAWAYDQFTVDVDTSDVQSVAFVHDNLQNRVTVTRDGSSEDWEVVEVERTDDGEATWVPIRGATVVDSTGNASTFVVYDEEAPNGGTVRYRARASYLLSGAWIVGPWTLSASGTSWSTDLCVVRALDKSTNTFLMAVSRHRANLAASRNVRQGVHRPLNSPHAITVSGPRQAPEGTLTLAVEKANRDTWDAMLEHSSWLVQAPAAWGWDIDWVGLGNAGIQRPPKALMSAETWPVAFVGTGRPADPSAGVYT